MDALLLRQLLLHVAPGDLHGRLVLHRDSGTAADDTERLLALLHSRSVGHGIHQDGGGGRGRPTRPKLSGCPLDALQNVLLLHHASRQLFPRPVDLVELIDVVLVGA